MTNGLRQLKKLKVEQEPREYECRVKGAEYAAQMLDWPVASMIKSLVVHLEGVGLVFASVGRCDGVGGVGGCRVGVLGVVGLRVGFVVFVVVVVVVIVAVGVSSVGVVILIVVVAVDGDVV